MKNVNIDYGTSLQTYEKIRSLFRNELQGESLKKLQVILALMENSEGKFIQEIRTQLRKDYEAAAAIGAFMVRIAEYTNHAATDFKEMDRGYSRNRWE